MSNVALTPNTNLIANGLTLPSLDSMKLAADISGQYCEFMKVIWMLNYDRPMEEMSISTVDGKRTTTILPDTIRTATLAANAVPLGGGQFQITFTDPTYILFRVDDIIRDTYAQKSARIVSAVPGSAVIAQADSAAINVASQFVAGRNVTCLDGVQSPNLYSSSPDGIYNDPSQQYNLANIVREGTQISRRNGVDSTMVQYKGKGWYFAYEQQMVQRIFRGLSFRFLFGDRYSDGTRNYNGGLDWLIPNRGGSVFSLPAAPSLADINDWIQKIIISNATPTLDIWCFCGTRFMLNFQQLATANTQYITNLGPRAELNGKSLVNYNVMTYSIMGVNVTFMRLPVLDYAKAFPDVSVNGGLKSSWTAYFLNLAPIPGVGGGMLPALEFFYFGAQPVFYGYVAGTIKDWNGVAGGSMGSMNALSGDVNLATYLSATDKDGISAYIGADVGVDARDCKAMVKFYISQ